MKKIIGQIVMFFFGWGFTFDIDRKHLKKCVLIAAPHTSNFDFILAVAGFWAMGINMKLFIKDNYTKPWYGFFIEWLGGIGVDRKNAGNMVEYAANVLKESDELVLLITPEGTRSFSEKWKKGFYYIAKMAKVPIIIGIGNYQDKEAQVVDYIDDLENKTLEEVFQQIEGYYKPEMAKYPEKYNPKIF